MAEVIGAINLGLALVEDGQAFAYRKYLGQCDTKEYLDAEYRAYWHRYGVWQVPGGITRPGSSDGRDCFNRHSQLRIERRRNRLMLASIPGRGGMP